MDPRIKATTPTAAAAIAASDAAALGIAPPDGAAPDIAPSYVAPHDDATHDDATHDVAAHDVAAHDVAAHHVAAHHVAAHHVAAHDVAAHDVGALGIASRDITVPDTASRETGALDAPPRFAGPRGRWLRKHPTLVIGALLLIAVTLVALCAPWLATSDPQDIDPLARLQPPSAEHRFGTDALGRDVYSRAVWGARVSLIVGVTVAALSTAIGVLLGLVAGFVRGADGLVMRVMDGLMAIPGVLLAIALMALTRGSVATVIVAITVPEVPRVVRLVRSLSLTLREQLFVEAAHAIGTRLPLVLWRHVLPNMMAPLVVQATFVAASAVLIEASLSFLGVGVPAQTPSWGNMMAEGRNFVAVAFHIILYPGMLLALTVLAINLLGDGLRDALDPRLARQL